MELTIEQALQQGVAAHKEGRLQEAENLYRSILATQPQHSDANHNLGVLAVGVGKIEEALPFFKAALEKDHKQGQYWLSYIDALIKGKRFDEAKRVIKEAENPGVSEDKLALLKAHLATVIHTKNVNCRNLSQRQINQLLEYYNNGRLDEAEKLAIFITKEFFDHPFGWQALGAVLKQRGRISEALDASQKSVLLAPQDPKAYSNLAVMLKELDQLNEAEASSRKAIVLKPNFAEAHYNLGITLQQLGRLEDTEASIRRAIALKSDFSEAHNDLSIALQKQGKLKKAEVIIRRAIALKSDYTEAYYNLGIILQERGKLEDGEAATRRAIALKSSFAEAHNNLGVTLKELGRLDEAEASIRQAIALKSDYAEGYNNLGVTLQKAGRMEEAEASLRQAIALESDYTEAQYNLGVILQELYRLDEAEEIIRQAIALKSDYIEAYSNLSTTLRELGRFDEAEATIKQAIILKSEFSEAYNNLGIILQELGRMEDAEVSIRRAITLRFNSAEAHNNLGGTLLELGRLEAAEASFRQAMAYKMGYVETMLNLSMVLHYLNSAESERQLLQAVLNEDAGDFGLKAGVNLAICNFLRGDFAASKKQLLDVAAIREKTSSKFQNEKVYHGYLLKILDWHSKKTANSASCVEGKNLYVIGESHSLAAHLLKIKTNRGDLLGKSKLIIGCKQWDLGNSRKNKFKLKFESIIRSLPKYSEVLLTIGEIDCRLHSGIIKHKNKFPEKDLEKIIATTVENYLNYILKNNMDCKHNITIQGVPCPLLTKEECQKKEIMYLIKVIKKFNHELKKKSQVKGCYFLDVHKLTDRGDGVSNAVWHIDGNHLSPQGILEAWKRHRSQ